MSAGERDHRARIQRMTSGKRLQQSEAGLPTVPGYVLHRLVGHGAQGSVYAATSDATGRVVAVKILAAGTSAESRNRRRFNREAKLLAKLDHPNITGIIDYGRSSDGAPYLAMDFVDGISIEDAIDSSTIEGLQRGISLFLEVCAAIDHAHRNGVVHRDLKFSNILVCEHAVKVLDFGLAKDLDDQQNHTQTGEVLGSLPWSSPEQVAGRRVGTGADIYALGVLLYWIAGRRLPIDPGKSLSQTVDAIRHGRTLPIRTIATVSDPAEFEAIIARAMATRIENRYRTVAELVRELKQWLAAKPVRKRSKVLRRALVVAGLTVTITGAVWLVWWHKDASAPVQFNQPTYVNSVGMDMILVPRHQFHERTPAYWISRTEVTVGQFNAVMGWPDAVNPNLPMHSVSFTEAQEFCRRLSERESSAYRLPTETEWQNACGGGRYGYAGNSDLPIASIAWTANDNFHAPSEVAKKRPNLWGIYDMVGNVAEWCISDELIIEEQPERGGSFLQASSQISILSRDLRNVSYRSHATGFRIISENLEILRERSIQ